MMHESVSLVWITCTLYVINVIKRPEAGSERMKVSCYFSYCTELACTLWRQPHSVWHTHHVPLNSLCWGEHCFSQKCLKCLMGSFDKWEWINLIVYYLIECSESLVPSVLNISQRNLYQKMYHNLKFEHQSFDLMWGSGLDSSCSLLQGSWPYLYAVSTHKWTVESQDSSAYAERTLVTTWEP